MSATEALVSLTETEYDDLPSGVLDHAKTCIRDVLGVAIYGSWHEIADQLVAYVDVMAPGEDAALLGRGTASAAGAALANGTSPLCAIRSLAKAPSLQCFGGICTV